VKKIENTLVVYYNNGLQTDRYHRKKTS